MTKVNEIFKKFMLIVLTIIIFFVFCLLHEITGDVEKHQDEQVYHECEKDKGIEMNISVKKTKIGTI